MGSIHNEAPVAPTTGAFVKYWPGFIGACASAGLNFSDNLNMLQNLLDTLSSLGRVKQWTFFALFLSTLFALTKLLVGEFSTLPNIEESLKQLITFSALLVTLIYAVMIPRLLSDQEKRDKYLEDFRSKCREIHLYKDFIYALYRISISRIQQDGLNYPSYLTRLPHEKISTYYITDSSRDSTPEEISNKAQLLHDFPELKARNFILFTAYLESIAYYGKETWDQGYSTNSPDNIRLITEEELWRIGFCSSKITALLFVSSGDIVDRIHRTWSNNLDNSIEFLKSIAINSISSLNLSKLDPAQNNTSELVNKTTRSFVHKSYNAAKLLVELNTDYSPKKYIHMFSSSSAVIAAGAIGPLLALLFEFSYAAKVIIACTSSISVLSFLMLFTIDLYQYLKQDNTDSLRMKKDEKITFR
ncbi:hypothetical protein LJ737_04155 [Hymenobacter sp. 15J16-1T3B]|uniref:hypothetical protein n=1 Tax=Hymenobacter sp. 15J16-1T3B TaxID=2886941 RepID=UPI001D110734|nr:hypothetical protein [Hymenobacter sp. 15J16-1T3B]MCC3156415.1 hypothetical protein [Hymenobacter sp. 15J16-1T3B]